MEIKVLQTDHLALWDEYVQKAAGATIYHTGYWREICSNVFKHKPIYIFAQEHGTVAGVLPLFKVGGIFGNRLVSIPLRDRGGPLYNSFDILIELVEKAKEIAIENNCKYLEIKTLSGIDYYDQMIVKRHLINTVIKLENNPAPIFDRFHSSVKRAIRKARREGVSIFWGKDLNDIRSFYKIFLKTRKKLGVPPYGFNLFQNIWSKLLGLTLR